MLILTRKVQTAIVIGDQITVTVLSIKGDQVRLGIDAPRDVTVHREEIYKRIQAENLANEDPDNEDTEKHENRGNK